MSFSFILKALVFNIHYIRVMLYLNFYYTFYLFYHRNFDSAGSKPCQTPTPTNIINLSHNLCLPSNQMKISTKKFKSVFFFSVGSF